MNSRLKEILSRKKAESEEEIRSRIRESVERQTYICPLCGFNRFFEEALHPYAGKNAANRLETRWCNGKEAFYSGGNRRGTTGDELG